MKIAIASGKGGTGKTMVATSLADSLGGQASLAFLECDVEAPNAHLFLKPEFTIEAPVEVPIPEIDPETCTLCGRCVEVCQYHALAKIGERMLVFPQLCHSCGSCTQICPEGAIHEVGKSIGTLREGQTSSGISFLNGELAIGEPMPTPIIREVKKAAPKANLTIIDCPPGASCSVVTAIHDADYVILVTEPTPFGWHDLKQMLGVLDETGTPAGIVVNRDGIGDPAIEDQLAELPLPILMRIPFREEIAANLARGELLTEILPEYREAFQALYAQIIEQTERSAA
ncbi:MAG: 4Fe-4S binding protein [Anaerolineaceae bacterium]|nr:4Fe-4S binding protein [Anaerolineaceae bacterium]